MDNILKGKATKGKIIYSIEHKDYTFVATELVPDECAAYKGYSLIEIFKKGNMDAPVLVKEFIFPSYKVWNIPAHADDIIEGIKIGFTDKGLRVAGSDGLGGNAYGG